jgi:hypothetical protein
MSSANSFGTFLETRQLLKGQNAPSSGSFGDADPQAEAAVRILKELPAAAPDLLRSTNLPMGVFFETLVSLQEQGVVQVRRNDAGDLVDLTDRGRALLSA